ncbi:MAG: 50S ribosomal protein L7/L12 [Flavobacteriales bacterium AspAUS03]
MATVEQLAEQLVNLTVKDVNELANVLKEKHGIEPATAVAVAPTLGGVAEQVEEKSTFDVVLKSAGAAKLKVIKAVKELMGKTLTEAKELVDAAPKSVLKQGANKEEAEGLKKQFEETGAEIELT